MSIYNRKYKFQYHLIDNYIAGIQLHGSEVKSIRQKKVNISESFCKIKNGELYSINMYIEKYKYAYDFDSFSPRRDRKLLLTKKELKKISKKLINNPTYTIIPIKIFFNKNGYAKMKISIAKGRKIYDKREYIRKKDINKCVNKYI